MSDLRKDPAGEGSFELGRLDRRGASLSKSRYMSGAQCHLRLWYDSRTPNLAPDADDTLQAIFDTGHEVGELAYKRYSGGHFVAHDYRHVADALEETRQVIDGGSAPALFEAAFVHRGVLVRADILERLPGGGWRLVEVKSTTRPKDVFVLDLAVQLWVLRGAGMDVREAGVLTLDRDYVYDGRRLDLNALFKLHPALDQANELLQTVGDQAGEMQSMLAKPVGPEIEPGHHCFTPYACPYYGHCTRNHVRPDHGIDELPWLSAARRDRLEAEGIGEIRDIPPDFALNGPQEIVRRAVNDGCGLVHGDIQGPLSKTMSPVRHLDFETFAPAIPRFVGTRPYGAIPFLFSVHTERSGLPPAHVDYLHERDDDPRPQLAEHLIEAAGRKGTICTYSGYERQVLHGLMEAIPERASALRAIDARLSDLLPVVRNGYYHPDFRGSFSIKSVLPVMVPTAGYDDLSIADGQTAAGRYVLALKSDDIGERQRIFAELRDYCAQDSLSLVDLRRALAHLASQ